MPVKVWEKLAEGLSTLWNARLLAPTVCFWGGGLVAWFWNEGWRRVVDFLKGAETQEGIAVTVTTVFVLGASVLLSQLLTLPVLRLVEGYWRFPAVRVRRALVHRLALRLQSKRKRWQVLALKSKKIRLNADEEEEYARLDEELSLYPIEPRLLMPTRVGNVLRAAEEYPLLRYGLEITVVWPRLWLVLPDLVRQEVSSARQALDERTGAILWSSLFVVWTIWAWWALPVGLLIAYASYRAALSAAGIDGELLRAAFDLHRFALYAALHWPIPNSPAEEADHGKNLTQYLFRGAATGEVRFIPVIRKN
jgi:hypothetical protein